MKHIKRDFRLKAWVRPLDGLRGWGRGLTSTCSEYGHVAYQIKGNAACSNMVANIFCRRPPPTHRPLLPRHWGLGKKVKSQLFQNMVMLHIKLNGIIYAGYGSKYFACRSRPRVPGGGVKRSKFNVIRKWSLGNFSPDPTDTQPLDLGCVA